MKPLRAVAVLPTLFTLGNLVCGFFAIVVASRIARPGTVDFVPAQKLESVRELINSVDPTHNLMLCGLLILLAMLFDVFDGQVARLAKVSSDFGAQLDSLCDVVSFGVAPAILLVKMCPEFALLHREATWVIAALFACCVALRLARFNVETDDEDDHANFVGLPSPAGAAVIASFGILLCTLRNEVNYSNFESFDWWVQRLLPILAVAIALLMVSRAPYPHIVTQMLRGQHSFAHLVGVVVTLVVLLTMRGFAVPIACLAYVLAPPLTHAWNLTRRYLRAKRM